MDHSPYLNEAMTRTASMIEEALQTLVEHEDEFDAIVCTGVSGMLIGPTLAYLMDKRLAVVRKPEDRSGKGNHATVDIESALNKKDRWLFVDDLIASGKTVQRIEHAMRMVTGFKGKMAGLYLYNSDRFSAGNWREETY